MTASTGPFRALGIIRTRHARREDTPVQAGLNRDDEGRIELDDRYLDALDGLAEFSHAWLLTWFGDDTTATVEPALRQVPFLLGPDGREMGIFAMHGPRRPNPIGLSLVRLVKIEHTSVHFAGVDMIDGTVLLDLKPYVAAFDRPDGDVRSGWFDDVDLPRQATPSSIRGAGCGR